MDVYEDPGKIDAPEKGAGAPAMDVHEDSGDELQGTTAAVSYIVDVPECAADLGFEHFQSGTAAMTTKQDGGNFNSGMTSLFAAQVFDGAGGDGPVSAVAGAFAESVRGGLPGPGLAAASLAVAGLTAGGAATPAIAFGLFAVLLGGVSLITIRVSRA